MLSSYFFRKNLKDILFFCIILLVATILFSSAIILKLNVGKDYNQELDRLHTADSFFVIPSIEYTDSLLEDIKDMKGITDVEIEKGIMLSVPVDMDGSIQEQNQIFYNIDASYRMNRREIIKRTHSSEEAGIYLSNYTFIHLSEKEQYSFTIDNIPYCFSIKGVVNEMQYGNYSSSVIGEYLEADAYQVLLSHHKDKEVVTLSIKSHNSHVAYYDVSKYLSSKDILVLYKNYKEQAQNARLAIVYIFVLILMTFATFMLIIGLFVSKFKIGQTIEKELSNMGVLKALGYTSNEMILSCIFPYVLTGFLFILLGIVASYIVLPIFSKIIEMQSGFIWKVQLYLDLNMLVILILLLFITVFTLLASLKIKKINIIGAMRGIQRSNNHKNYFEIERTKGNIHFILMLKNFMNTKRENVLLGIVLFLLTLVASFVGILFYNINMNPMYFINTLVEEHPSLVVSSNIDLRNEIKMQDNVKGVMYYDENITVQYNHNAYKTLIAEDFLLLANDLCYLGRNPKNETEVAIGSKIQEIYHIHIGDFITLHKNGIEHQYKVVGLIQSVNYAGEVIEMTIDGYKQLDSLYVPKTMYVYLENEKRTDEFLRYIQDQYQDDILSIMNYVEALDSAVHMYVVLIRMICIIMIVVTLLLLYFILYILISSLIVKRKQEFGILKAMGYENKQLIRQVVGGFFPSMLIGTGLGLLVGKIFMPSVYHFIFRGVGVYKVSFVYPFIVFFNIVIFLLFSTIMIGIVLSRRLKKITAYSLIKDL